jgi:2-dehydropantoate 2-reductase
MGIRHPLELAAYPQAGSKRRNRDVSGEKHTFKMSKKGEAMKFLIVGPGAMGCLFAARLKLAGNEVVLLDYDRGRAQRISEQGISVTGVSGDYTVPVMAIVEGSPLTPDFILICVKANHTGQAAMRAASFAGPDTMVVTLQNGLGNIEKLAAVFGPEKVLGGVTAQGATLLDWARIRHAGKGETVIGPGGSGKGRAHELVSSLNSAGFETRLVDSVEELIWGKLIVNVGINALTAIVGVKNGRIAALPGVRGVMEEAVKEGVGVATAKGIRLPYEKPLDRVLAVCEATKDNVSSMLQDVLKERPTEIEMINGAIAREGEGLGVPTPVNKTLTSLVQGIQETYQERVE